MRVSPSHVAVTVVLTSRSSGPNFDCSVGLPSRLTRHDAVRSGATLTRSVFDSLCTVKSIPNTMTERCFYNAPNLGNRWFKDTRPIGRIFQFHFETRGVAEPHLPLALRRLDRDLTWINLGRVNGRSAEAAWTQ
jgi:hypothetical protein